MTESTPAPRRKNYSWSELLKRIFDIDSSVCERCGGPVRVAALAPFFAKTVGLRRPRFFR